MNTAFDRSPWTYWNTGTLISANPATGDYPTITVGTTSLSADFWGMVTGDFNRSFIPGGLKDGIRNLDLIYADSRKAEAASNLELPVYAISQMTVGAVSMILHFPSDLVEIKDVSMKNTGGNLDWAVNGDELRIGWHTQTPVTLAAAEELLVISLRTTTKFTQGKSIRFILDDSPLSELADGSYEVIPNGLLGIGVVESSSIGIGELTVSEEIRLFNYPNPFNTATTIAWSLPFDGKVTVDVFSMLGAYVKNLVNETQDQGEHQLNYDTYSLQPGVYFVTLKLQGNNQTLLRTIKIIRNK
jgi:hypothetical protein